VTVEGGMTVMSPERRGNQRRKGGRQIAQRGKRPRSEESNEGFGAEKLESSIIVMKWVQTEKEIKDQRAPDIPYTAKGWIGRYGTITLRSRE